MKGSKKLDSLLEDNKKKLKSYLNMIKSFGFHKRRSRKSKISMGFMLFLIKETSLRRTNWWVLNDL